jgi:molecular chaperone GrpE
VTSFPQEGQVDFDPETVDETASGSAPAGDPAAEAADGAGVGPVEQEVLDTADEEARAAELTADLKRVQAEFLNYKRRVDRDRDLVKQNATFSVLSALLPVLDDVDRAREHGELNGGFKAVAEALERIVSGQGLEKFGAPGEPFDPRIHEALMHGLSTEVDTTTCDKVVQAGYRIGERVVRPALVTVVDPDPAGETAGPEDSVSAAPAAPPSDALSGDLPDDGGESPARGEDG